MTNRKPLLMLSLPNSGSTWLAEQIAQTTSWSSYSMEYFNPLRNPLHYGRLSSGFGCELVDCYRNIALDDYADFDDDVRDTFMRSGFNFTKEVFSPFKMRAFLRHFSLFVLLREQADTFPPKRARVWSFYEHAWFAMTGLKGVKLAGTNCQSRAIAAYRHMHDRLEQDAKELDVPIIRYRDLFDDHLLPVVMFQAIGECNDNLLNAIGSTRVLSDR
jgi:hypothetical protein